MSLSIFIVILENINQSYNENEVTHNSCENGVANKSNRSEKQEENEEKMISFKNFNHAFIIEKMVIPTAIPTL